MKILYIITFSMFFGNCNAQKSETNNVEHDKYQLETKLFLNDVYQKELNKTELILVDQPEISCVNDLPTDFFSTSEMAQLKAEIKNPKIKNWKAVLTNKIKYIDQDTIKDIFDSKRDTDGWTYFYKNYGHSFNSISAPIFFRDYTYCLFYSSNSCGWLCGTGTLVLYKKVKDKWVQERNFCSWIS